MCLESGALGSRGRALRRIDRRARGRRAARRRRGVRRQGRAGPSATSTARSPTPSRGRDADDQARPRPAADRARRHANKARLGANAILGVSLAAARAQRPTRASRCTATSAASRRTLLPVPMMNVLNGGAHADNTVDFQEFMIVPVGAELVRGGAADGRRDLPRAQGTLQRARPRHRRRRRGRLRARRSSSNEAALELLVEAIEAPATAPATTSRSALDPASSEFFDDGALPARRRGPHAVLRARWSTTGRALARQLPDRVARGRHGRGRLGRLGACSPSASAAESSSSATTSSSPTRRSCAAASTRGIANSILIKLNQIGTLTETLETIAIAREAGYRAVISHRSGETEDTFDRRPRRRHRRGPDQDRRAGPHRARREVQPALRIEEQLGERAQFAGRRPSHAKQTLATHSIYGDSVAQAQASRRFERATVTYQ